jgi:RHS repeat-associated protein
MIDAEIEGGQISKRYIFINLRPVAVIEYAHDTNHDQNSQKNKENNSKESNETVGYSAKSSPKSTAIYAIHTDHLGTPQAITDDKQAVVWRADYATFGKATVQARVIDSNTKTAKAATSFGIISSAHAANAATATAKPFEFNLRFAGQYEDTESGYHYNWHRYYDPSTGRYLTPDPIGLAGGLNGYGYAGQDPIRRIDPWGLYTVFIGGAGDASTFAGTGPTGIMSGVRNQFDKDVIAAGKNETTDYFGYEDETKILAKILEVLKKNPNEKINIVGHSLGGWVGAKVAAALAKCSNAETGVSYKVNNLVTLDPVGTRYFFFQSKPVPSANNWINILANPTKPDGTDTIADLGGRWKNPTGANNSSIDLNHYDAGGLFTNTPSGGSSASQVIIDGL